MNSAATPAHSARVPDSLGRAPVALPLEPVPIPVPGAIDAAAGAPLRTASARTPIPLDVRVRLLREYGSFGYAYAATFQPGMEHFGDERGFLAFKMVGGTALVLSDPIAPRENHADLIARFVQEKGDVCFWCASRPTAVTLASLGFFVNEMGPENRIDLAKYDFSGRSKDSLRRSVKRAAKLGYVTRECSFDSLDIADVNAVSGAWRGTRTVRTHEISFLNRPIVLADELDVRKFFTFDPSGKIVAFSFFDPVYQNGRVVGYLNNIKRRRPDADSLVATALMREAISTFQRDGMYWLFLGISPFADLVDVKWIKDDGLKRSRWMWRCFRAAYKNPLLNRFVFPSQHLHEHKRRYGAVTAQTYYATNRRPSLFRLLKVLRGCRIV